MHKFTSPHDLMTKLDGKGVSYKLYIFQIFGEDKFWTPDQMQVMETGKIVAHNENYAIDDLDIWYNIAQITCLKIVEI